MHSAVYVSDICRGRWTDRQICMVLSLGTALKEKIQSFRSGFAGVYLSSSPFGGRLEGLVF